MNEPECLVSKSLYVQKKEARSYTAYVTFRSPVDLVDRKLQLICFTVRLLGCISSGVSANICVLVNLYTETDPCARGNLQEFGLLVSASGRSSIFNYECGMLIFRSNVPRSRWVNARLADFRFLIYA